MTLDGHGSPAAVVARLPALLLAGLLLAALPPGVALRTLTEAGSSADPTGPLVAIVALLAWAVTGWLALTVTVVLLSRLPGLLGRTARAVARRVAPTTVRRALEVTLGLTVTLGVAAPSAAVAAPAPRPAVPAPTAVPETAWDLDWPGTTGAAASPPPRTATPVPSATRSPTAAEAAAPAGVPTVAAAPAPAVASEVARTARPPATVQPSPAPPAPARLVVRSGDTLWSLAETSLRGAGTARPSDRQVAQAWPRWWEANREAIGDDPDLLLPGTVLHPPAGSPGSP